MRDPAGEGWPESRDAEKAPPHGDLTGSPMHRPGGQDRLGGGKEGKEPSWLKLGESPCDYRGRLMGPREPGHVSAARPRGLEVGSPRGHGPPGGLGVPPTQPLGLLVPTGLEQEVSGNAACRFRGRSPCSVSRDRAPRPRS